MALPFLVHAADVESVDQGKEVFLNGDYAAALVLFENAFSRYPDNPEVNFYLGRSAFEQGDYEMACMAFERVLIADPAASRVRLEQARTLYCLGNFEQARQAFNEVAQTAPPAEVLNKINYYLKRIEQQQRRYAVHGMVAAGLTSDDNVYASPADSRINTILGDVLLSGSNAREKSDIIHHAGLALGHDYFVAPQLTWKSQGQLYGAWYRDADDLDLQLISLASGPTWKIAQGRLSVSGQFDHLDLDGERYLQMVGGQICYAAAVTPRWHYLLSVRVADKNYFQDDAKDSTVVGGHAALNWQSGAGLLTLAAGGENEDARQERNSFSSSSLSLAFSGDLPLSLRYTLGCQLKHSRYRAIEPLFDTHRNDRQYLFSSSLSYQLWRSADRCKQLTAKLAYSYSNVNSTIELYEYDKNVADVSLIFNF